MQTLQLQLGTQAKPEAPAMPIVVRHGQLQQLHKGDVIQVIASHIKQGKAQVNIQGQNIQIEGLQKNLEGKEISLKVTKTGEHPQFEILNTKTVKTTSKNKYISQHSPHTFSAKIKSQVPSWLKHQKQAIVATVSKHEALKSTTTLKLQAPEQLKIPQKSTLSLQHIKIENPSHTTQLGDTFKIQISKQHSNTLVLQTQRNSPTATSLNQISNSTAIKAPLAIGSTLNTMVQQRLPSGLIAFQWQQHSFEAAAPSHVKIGDILQLKVTQTGVDTKFNVIQHIPQGQKKASQIFRQHIGQSEPQHKNLNTLLKLSNHMIPAPTKHHSENLPIERLQHWINSHALNAGKPINGPILAQTLQLQGQHFEARLAQAHNSNQIEQIKQQDLKSVLLQVADHIKHKPASDDIQQFKTPTQQAIARIESLQAVNVLAHFQAEPTRFELPIMLQGQLMQAYLSIQQDDSIFQHDGDEHDGNHKQSFNILFSLNLKALGDLRIDARIQEDAVYARFYHSHDKALNFIQQHIHRLHESLQKLGFKELYLTNCMDQQMPKSKQQAFTQLLNPTPKGDGLLDIQA